MTDERLLCPDDEHDYHLIGGKYHKPTDDAAMNALTWRPEHDSKEIYVSLYCRKCGDTIERQATTGRPA